MDHWTTSLFLIIKKVMKGEDSSQLDDLQLGGDDSKDNEVDLQGNTASSTSSSSSSSTTSNQV
jgi:hypothetical protein